MFGPAERQAYLRFRSDIEALLDPALYSITWLDRQLIEGVFRAWAGENAIIVTGLKQYPTGAVDIEGIVAAGDVGEIVSGLIPRAEEWARGAGCVGAIIESREAWSRLLKPHGYSPHQISIRKAF